MKENKMAREHLSKMKMPPVEAPEDTEELELDLEMEEEESEESNPLAAISDEQLMAEFKARGLSLEEEPIDEMEMEEELNV